LPKKLSLFVFIDALGWEILQQHPFMGDVLPRRAPVDTVFGYSCTCAPTYLTGRLPREHGHFSFFYYSPSTSPFRSVRLLSLLPRSLTRRGRVRRLLSSAIRRAHGFTGYFQIYNVPFEHLPLFDYSEKRDLYQPGGINAGTPTVFDELRRREIPFHLSNWRRPETENLDAAERAVAEGGVSFAYVYLADLDAIVHAEGPRAEAVRRKIEWYERRLRRLLDVARSRYEDVHVHVFSDHGQVAVRTTVDLIARVESTGLSFGRDYVAMYDSTMARFWFLHPEARSRIAAELRCEPLGRILADEDLASLGCDFPDRRYGEMFFLVDPGVIICPSFMGETAIAGMHGYDPFHRDSLACWSSNVEPTSRPRSLVDMHGLMIGEAGA
jgi:predicted AlkP superfamily pyrophosphatase or phosphodiesterase